MNIFNRTRKKRKFGNDALQIKWKKKEEYAGFLSLIEELSRLDISSEDTEEISRRIDQDMMQFIEEITRDNSEDEYSDYRNYFVYDIEITTVQNGKTTTFDLSKKQASSSNGEKKTPYLILSAMALSLCQAEDNNCAKLLIMDEAFSTLSEDRTKELIYFFEACGFQAIYAVPDNRISEIGSIVKNVCYLESYKGIYVKSICLKEKDGVLGFEEDSVESNRSEQDDDN